MSRLVQVPGIVIRYRRAASASLTPYSSSRTQAKATEVRIRCKSAFLFGAKANVHCCAACNTLKTIYSRPGFTSIQMPSSCDAYVLIYNARYSGLVLILGHRNQGREGAEKCDKDPYEVLLDKCKFADTQSLKLQESPETIPTGEMPRHILLLCDRVRSLPLLIYVCPRTVLTTCSSIYATVSCPARASLRWESSPSCRTRQQRYRSIP